MALLLQSFTIDCKVVDWICFSHPLSLSSHQFAGVARARDGVYPDVLGMMFADNTLLACLIPNRSSNQIAILAVWFNQFPCCYYLFFGWPKTMMKLGTFHDNANYTSIVRIFVCLFNFFAFLIVQIAFTSPRLYLNGFEWTANLRNKFRSNREFSACANMQTRWILHFVVLNYPNYIIDYTIFRAFFASFFLFCLLRDICAPQRNSSSHSQWCIIEVSVRGGQRYIANWIIELDDWIVWITCTEFGLWWCSVIISVQSTGHNTTRNLQFWKLCITICVHNWCAIAEIIQ